MSDYPVDRVIPKEKWEFDEDVAKCFNNMLERSIPGYSDMRLLCHSIGKRFIDNESYILDLGASRGEALRPFIESNVGQLFTGLEMSLPMREEMFNEFGANQKVRILDWDLRHLNKFAQLEAENKREYSLILSVLTLMFTPIQYRLHILHTIYSMLKPGGAFILVEKVLGSCSEIDDILVDAYYELKNKNGYSPDDIQRKKASLEGVQVPITHDANVDWLKSSGFRKVDSFYRNLNFVGWVAIK